MRTAFVLALLVAAVVAEKCMDKSECQMETCAGDNNEVACQMGLCTCVASGTGHQNMCNTDADCPTHNMHECHGRRHQCIGGHCRCPHH